MSNKVFKVHTLNVTQQHIPFCMINPNNVHARYNSAAKASGLAHCQE